MTDSQISDGREKSVLLQDKAQSNVIDRLSVHATLRSALVWWTLGVK